MQDHYSLPRASRKRTRETDSDPQEREARRTKSNSDGHPVAKVECEYI